LNSSYLYQVNFSGALLQGVYFTRADLLGANLSNLNLTRTKFRGAALSMANLSGANLTEADLCLSDLAYANLTNANLTNALLIHANLAETNLQGAILEGTFMLPQSTKNKVYIKLPNLIRFNGEDHTVEEWDQIIQNENSWEPETLATYQACKAYLQSLSPTPPPSIRMSRFERL
jgi:uncharacterized protein YjbI with pentapeptide repeats